MQVISVNVGLPREVAWNGTRVRTAIFKEPVAGPVSVSNLNFAGDEQADLTVHGGVDKAVYGYPAEHYEYWRNELAETTLPWGSFGENLTTRGLLETSLCIGDRLRIGSAVLEVTQPRMPCYKLGIRFGRDDMIKRFLLSGRSGFYFSVIEQGTIAAGSPIEFLNRDSNQVSVADLLRLYLGKKRDDNLLQRAISIAALPEAWKSDLLLKAERMQS